MTRPRRLLAVLVAVALLAVIAVWQPWGAPVPVRMTAWRLGSIEGVADVRVEHHRTVEPVHGERFARSVVTISLEPGIGPDDAGDVAARARAAVGEPDPHLTVRLVGDDLAVDLAAVTTQEVVDAVARAG